MSILLRQEGISTAYHVMLSHSLAQQRRIRIITFQRSYLTTDQYLIGRSRRVISARAPTSNGHAGIALTMQTRDTPPCPPYAIHLNLRRELRPPTLFHNRGLILLLTSSNRDYIPPLSCSTCNDGGG